MAVERVPAHYGFTDISMIGNPTPQLIAELKEKNRALVSKLRDRFYYRVCASDVLLSDAPILNHG